MYSHFKTERLTLEPLQTMDAGFIRELVNTPEWIKFIGDRGIDSDAAAEIYIGNILNNPDVQYWVVKMADSETPIGVITFIKREYLEFHDIGFAFLPQFAKRGFATEAASVVLSDLLTEHETILASTVPENINSIRLLEKLGMEFDREIEIESERLLVYAITENKM